MVDSDIWFGSYIIAGCIIGATVRAITGTPHPLQESPSLKYRLRPQYSHPAIISSPPLPMVSVLALPFQCESYDLPQPWLIPFPLSVPYQPFASHARGLKRSVRL